MFNVRSVSVYRLLIVYRKNNTKIANKENKKRSKFAKKSERVQKIHNGSLATVYAILTVRNGNYCLSGKAEKSVEKTSPFARLCATRWADGDLATSRTSDEICNETRRTAISQASDQRVLDCLDRSKPNSVAPNMDNFWLARLCIISLSWLMDGALPLFKTFIHQILSGSKERERKKNKKT